MTAEQLLIKVGNRIKGSRLIAGYELDEAAEQMGLDNVSELEEVEEGEAYPSALMLIMLSALYTESISFFSPRHFSASKSDEGVWQFDECHWDTDAIEADVAANGLPSDFEMFQAMRDYYGICNDWLNRMTQRHTL